MMLKSFFQFTVWYLRVKAWELSLKLAFLNTPLKTETSSLSLLHGCTAPAWGHRCPRSS